MESQLDLSTVAVKFTRLLRLAGLNSAPERAGNFVQFMQLLVPSSVGELYWCARIALVSRFEEIGIFDPVFFEIFGNLSELQPSEAAVITAPTRRGPETADPNARRADPQPTNSDMGTISHSPSEPQNEVGHSDEARPIPTLASGYEKLMPKNFADLTPEELLALLPVMAQLTRSLPMRITNRTQAVSSHGDQVDLRESLRRARRSGGDVALLARRKFKPKPRRIVALLDTSGSMEPYVRAFLHFLHLIANRSSSEVFTFATRLTRITKELKGANLDTAINTAGEKVPDWSSGTQIGNALATFIDHYGRRGIARGAVVVIFSDGWEHGDLSLLSQQMQRLSLLAHRIVWVNPRSAQEDYLPLAGGMAAALPFCDAFVSGHSAEALEKLVSSMTPDY